ncbi:ADP-ribosylation/Crystallin J1 [Xylariomycetidae sp. FL2044]|nr:ADP-ribosylation/Crystallin J1 [Xylariomycetidae sp. FL2044]
MAPLPSDYLERVYAGVLGKLIGVYVGRPFEGWTHQQIMNDLGPIYHYVHEKFKAPLVVTDDDVSGTFTFVRALEEHGVNQNLSAESIGKTWLNNVINRRTIFWWGGRGISTEHTAFLNLKEGIPAPRSGSIETNGKTVAEQIGAQIFIDGWALVSPGNPSFAAKLAKAAGSVSHDGDSVDAAVVWAAMEAEAFVSKDIDHLLDTGLKQIPYNSMIAGLIRDIRGWSKEDGDWKRTRQRIEDEYGYHHFHGVCHVVPNHGIMIMALIYAGHDFHEAMHIINTCGWDTDCNSGNVGCLVAIMNGLPAFEDGPDWRGPLADRALISSADAGYTFNNAARIAYDLGNMGRQLAGEPPFTPPKDGAQFHFTLPGSVQGFQATHENGTAPRHVKVEQAVKDAGASALAVRLSGLTRASEPVQILTQTFSPPEVRDMRTYDLVGSPLVYPGQIVRAAIHGDASNNTSVIVRLALKAYTTSDELELLTGDHVKLEPGKSHELRWEIPHSLGSRPIQAIGIQVSTPERRFDGTVWLEYLRWDGTPQLTLKPDPGAKNDFWKRSFVNGADIFHSRHKFSVAQDSGEGIVTYGTREWTDYRVRVQGFVVNIGKPSGVAVRVQGLNRYYALLFQAENTVALVKAYDDQRTVLASTEFAWYLDVPYAIALEVSGTSLRASIGDDIVLTALDSEYAGGGIGLVTTAGSIQAESMEIGPLT